MMTLLLQLQVRGHASGKELAKQLQVSERTVERDVEALVSAGIPVRSTRGPAGGHRLDGGYRTRLTGFGLDEAGALAFLGLAGPAQQLGLGEMLEGARIKVWASPTGEARQRGALGGIIARSPRVAGDQHDCGHHAAARRSRVDKPSTHDGYWVTMPSSTRSCHTSVDGSRCSGSQCAACPLLAEHTPVGQSSISLFARLTAAVCLPLSA
jgi:biotin operon repressor